MKKYIVNIINKIAPFVIFLLISIVYATPLFKNINNWGQMDWDQFTFWNAVPYESIMKYHQFPLWNPYGNGGNVLLAHPHSSFLCPLYIFVLIFGPLAGLKIQIIVYLLIGFLGMYLLAKILKLNGISSYLPPIVFMLSSLYALHVAEGHTEWFTMAVIPWLFYFYIKSFEQKKFILLAVVSLSLMIFSGSVNVLSIAAVLIGVFCVFMALQLKRAEALKNLIFIFAGAILLCSVKLLPMFEFIRMNPRYVEPSKISNITMLKEIFLSRAQNEYYQNTKWASPDKPIVYKAKKFEYGWHEYGAYVGILPLILAIAGLFLYFRKYWPLVLTGIISFLISLGTFHRFNLWDVLNKLPFYSSLRVPSRYILGMIFVIAVFAGLGLSYFEKKLVLKAKIFKLIPFLAVIFISLDLFLVNFTLLDHVFTQKMISIPRFAEFRQRYRTVNLLPGKSRSSMFPVFLSNSGIIDSYEVIALKKGDVKIVEDQGYKAEAYLAGPKGQISINMFSPNRIIVDCNIDNGGLLILNQNYFSGWRIRKQKNVYDAISYGGLIATPVEKHDKRIEFFYAPRSFSIGLFISAITLTITLAYVLRLLIRGKNEY